jgi:multicomponent Na+:H+ antiporter subunit F
MFIAVSSVILVAIAVGLVRAIRGPTLYDRVLAANMIGTLTVLMVAVLGFMTGRPEFLDIALVYVLISFVSTLAVLRVKNPCADTTGSSAKGSGEG